MRSSNQNASSNLEVKRLKQGTIRHRYRYRNACALIRVRMVRANTALAVIMNVKQPNEFTCTLRIRTAADKVAIELGIKYDDVSYTCMNI